MRSLALLAVPFVACGCNPTYAPPVRPWQHVAPGRLAQGELEIGGIAGGVATPHVGGPRAAYALTDWVAVENATNLNLVGTGWALQSAGLRFTLTRALSPRLRLSADLEIGGGIGVGGVRCDTDPCDGIPWSGRLAGGGYQGVGFGLHIKWFSIYVRGKVDEALARNVPLTIWPAAMLGLGFDIKHRAAIDLGYGYLGYFNRIDQEHGPVYQLAATVFFDAGRRR